jgi:hypothetical protein
MGRIFASKDFLAGVLFLAFGLLGLWLARSLPGGAAGAMEAGYFPRLICGLLVIIGAALALISLFRESEVPERGLWRPFFFITAASLAFALLLRPLGLVVTLAISTVLARLAAGNIRLLPLVLLCLILIGAIVGTFVHALRIMIPLWPAGF